jgi:hypothetical protein
MQAALDAAGGPKIAHGDYAAALEELGAANDASKAAESTWHYTNLCVARTMARQVDAALASCDEAIERAATRGGPFDTVRVRSDRLALMYSNRAVADWLAGRFGDVETDLAKASSMAPKLPVVKANVAAFRARKEVLPAANGE